MWEIRKEDREERREEGQTLEDDKKKNLVPRQRMRSVQKTYVGPEYAVITNKLYNLISCSQNSLAGPSSESRICSDAIWWHWPLSMCLPGWPWQRRESQGAEPQPVTDGHHPVRVLGLEPITWAAQLQGGGNRMCMSRRRGGEPNTGQHGDAHPSVGPGTF